MSATIAASRPSSPARRAEGRFYVGMALVAMSVTAAGFGPALLAPASRKAPINFAVAAHGAVFGAWLLLFLAQTVLVGKGRIGPHRRLGYAGAALAVLMVVSGCFTAIAMARRGYDLSGDLNVAADPIGQLVFQFGDLLSFSVLVAAGIWFRRRPQAHKRLMLLATIGPLMPASLAHIIGHSVSLRALPGAIVLLPLGILLFANAVHDKLTRGRIHPVSLWVAAALFVWAFLRGAVIGPSEQWRRFATWLVG